MAAGAALAAATALAGGPAGARREVGVIPLGRAEGGRRFAVRLVRPAPGARVAAACVLEVELPAWVGVHERPRVWVEGAGVEVRLLLGPGCGGTERYALDECPPEGARLRVRVGAAW